MGARSWPGLGPNGRALGAEVQGRELGSVRSERLTHEFAESLLTHDLQLRAFQDVRSQDGFVGLVVSGPLFLEPALIHFSPAVSQTLLGRSRSRFCTSARSSSAPKTPRRTGVNKSSVSRHALTKVLLDLKLIWPPPDIDLASHELRNPLSAVVSPSWAQGRASLTSPFDHSGKMVDQASLLITLWRR